MSSRQRPVDVAATHRGRQAEPGMAMRGTGFRSSICEKRRLYRVHQRAFDPAVSGANVVYTQGSGFFTKIWITNLDILQLIPAVASHVLFNGVLVNSQNSADISGGKVVWTQITPLAVQQVMVLNLNTMNAALVTSTGVNQFDGAISNGIIVWTQGNTFFNAIYWRNTLNGQHGKLT